MNSLPPFMKRVSLLLLASLLALLSGVAMVAALDGNEYDSRPVVDDADLQDASLQAAGVQDPGLQGVGLQQGRSRGLVAGSPVTTHTVSLYLPIIFRSYLTEPYDMVDFLVGDDRLFEVQHSGGSQARHQTQVERQTFFHTKGNEISAEWEELWYTDAYIYRGTDTSPGNGQYYTLRDPGIYGSRWAPRFWVVGGIYERNPQVTFYQKSNCTPALGGTQRSYLKFENYYEEYTFESGIMLENVVELAWLLQPNGQAIERYFYAEFYGLVGWWSSSGAHSYISEIHEPGARPDNLREVIPCLDRSPAAPPQFLGPLPFWPGEHRR